MKSLNHAVDLFRRGQARQAELACERRLASAAGDVDAMSLLAEIRTALGNAAGARECLNRMTRLRPRDASAWRRLANAEISLDRPGEAAAALRVALELEPANVRAHNNLGQALMRLQRYPEAISSFEAALHLDPRYAIGHYNLGLALNLTGDSDRALAAFRQALGLDPSLSAALAPLAALYVQRCRWLEALPCYDQALLVQPSDAVTMTQKAFALLSLERAEEALSVVEEALRLDGNYAEAHNIRAGALRRVGRHAEALCSLDRTVALSPGYVDAWCNRGMVQHELGDVDGSLASYRQALQLNPEHVQARTRLLSRLIPSVPMSAAEASAARSTFDAELHALESWLDGRTLGEADALTVAEQQFFYLSYEEQSNKPLLARYRGASAARLARFAHLAPSGTGTGGGAPGVGRFRLGVISAHVNDHSVYHAITRGWLQHLDRERFEVTLFSLGQKQDSMTSEAGTLVERFEAGPRPLADWIRTIGGAGCDALIYPELGMNSPCLALASLRLAPRQYAAWGHPETSGLPTMDGFLSAEAFEPADAEEHYSERLWRLPRLGVHCRPHGVVAVPAALDELGITRDGPLFVCPGVPFKYRPDDDAVLVDIAQRLGRCRFVFFQFEVAELSHKLQARIGAAFRQAGLDPAQYLVLVPWQPRAAFFGLLRAADAYLDTVGFSGFNSLMQAIECQLPCVSYEGRFMRGRLGSGILRHMGLDELVAVDRRSFADMAVRLGASAGYRAAIRDRIREAEPLLYGDVGAVDALARILIDARDAS